MRRLLACAVLALSAQPAFAQGAWTGRARVSFSGGVQVDTTRLSESITLTKNVELAPISAEMPKAAAPFIDGGVAVRLAGNIGVGLSISYLTNKDDADVTADIPHPFFFNRQRSISGQATDVQHNELATHLDLVYLVVSPRIDLALSGGASFFSVEQDFVSDVVYADVYPYDTASFVRAELTREKESKTGYNVGADVTWKLTPRWGIGGLLRFSRARIPFTIGDLDLGTITAGGLQAGAGIRVIFPPRPPRRPPPPRRRP